MLGFRATLEEVLLLKPSSIRLHGEEDLAWLRRLARRLAARESAVADDLAQEAALAALRGGGPSDPTASRAWLGETMRRIFFGHMRTAVRRRRREQHWFEQEIPDGEDLERTVLDAEACMILREELAALPEHHRAILCARFLEERRADAIAADLGVPAATVRSRTFAAVAALRARVERRYRSRTRGLVPLLPAGGMTHPWAFWRGLCARMRWTVAPSSLVLPAVAVMLALLLPLSRTAEYEPTAWPALHPQVSAMAAVRRGPRAPAFLPTVLPSAGWPEAPANEAPAAALRAIPPADDDGDCPSAQPLLDAAPAGATVRLPPCIHRETLRVRKRLHVVGDGAAEIRGSEVFTFDPAPAGWISRQYVPLPRPMAAMPGELFRDGVPLRAVEGRDPGPGEYRLLASRRLLVTEPPTGHVFEVSVRGHWLLIEADGVTVEGVSMRHAANAPDESAFMMGMSRGVTLRRAQLQLARGGLVGGGGEGSVIEDCILGGAGAASLQVWAGSFTVRRSQFLGGNRFGSASIIRGAAIEGYGTRLLIEDNHLIGNNGRGVRCVNCAAVSLSGNTIADNAAAGISLEYVTGARVVNNHLSRNGGRWQPGISGTCSRDAEVRGNLLTGNGAGIWVRCPAIEIDVPSARRERLTVVNNAVHDNTVVSASPHALLWIDAGESSDETLAALGNSAWGNAFAWPDDAAPRPFAVSGHARSWEQFRGSSFGRGSRRLIAAEAEWNSFVLGGRSH